ncbi:MAG TPA: hypothetical protein ENI64_05265 [Gammaproteobacteria bacterium]|nr:hypothetical protein [Gammaproteobacteria bacterium]
MVFYAAVFLLAACRSSPILNIDNAPINISATHSSADIKKAIIRAGSALGWQMKSDRDGHLLATLILRSHVAIVDITFDKKSYTIMYKDSKNLNYDGTNIHSNYNGWIQNLNQNIQAQISTL